MTSELSTCTNIMLHPDARITVKEPSQVKNSETWAIHIDCEAWPHGSSFTEEQVRAIAAGYQPAEEEEADPDQLDALDEPPAPMTDLGTQAFDLGVTLNKIGTVASW